MEVGDARALLAEARGTRAEDRIVRSAAKRALDASVSVTALVLLSPVIAICAALIVFDSGWPAFYVHERVGLRGATFRMWKFRTMVNGADGRKDQLRHRNEAPFPAFKIRDDPRVTKVGKFMRRSSLDELPQLWNILRGEMSLVGPRPPLPAEVLHYDARASQRLLVRPGLTCYWQVEHRHRSTPISFEDWLELDRRYIREWSMSLDATLLMRTVQAVLRMTGT